jgi:hypothetical protein
MQSPVQIDFQGMKPREALRAIIAEHVAALEDRFGRITACRVVVKAPSEHHRTGGLYEINIRLALPDGKEVDIGRTPVWTSGMRTSTVLSTMHSSGRADSCRIRSAGCKAMSKRIRFNRSV